MGHDGSTFGFSTDFVLMPDAKAGVFMSMSPTPSNANFASLMLSTIYTLDILMEEEPWLNLTTACTFPEPWSELPEFPWSGGEHYNLEGGPNMFRNTGIPKSMADILPDKFDIAKCISGNVIPNPNKFNRQDKNLKMDQFTGSFGHFSYGNVTVEETENGVLMLSFGQLAKFELAYCGNNTFYEQGYGKFWPFDSIVIYDVSESGMFNELLLATFDLSFPVFVRDLDMSDAPPPPDPTDCGGGI